MHAYRILCLVSSGMKLDELDSHQEDYHEAQNSNGECSPPQILGVRVPLIEKKALVKTWLPMWAKS